LLFLGELFLKEIKTKLMFRVEQKNLSIQIKSFRSFAKGPGAFSLGAFWFRYSKLD